ncbi:MAG: OmpA family protein [Rhodospirillales bacterium]
MRRTVLTLSLLTMAILPVAAQSQVVVGSGGSPSVTVDYSVLGMPGAGSGNGYSSGGYAAGSGGLLMPNGEAPQSRILVPEFSSGTTIIGGSGPSAVTAPSVAGGSGLTPEAMALLGGQGAAPALAPPPVAATPKPRVRETPPEPKPAPAEVAKVEPKIEVTRPTPPKPAAPEAPSTGETATEPPAAPAPEASAAPAAPEPAPAPAQPPATAAAPAPAAPAPPAPPAPVPTQVATAEPGPAAPATGAPDSAQLAFTPGETRLPSEGIASLEQIARAAAADESLRIQLLAYASADGGPSSTARRISLKRALNVRKFLIDKDVRASRIDVRALGNRVPSGDPDRVDVTIARR